MQNNKYKNIYIPHDLDTKSQIKLQINRILAYIYIIKRK